VIRTPKPTTTQSQSPASTIRQFEYFLCRATEQKMYREQYKKTNLLKIASKEVTFYKYFKILVFYRGCATLTRVSCCQFFHVLIISCFSRVRIPFGLLLSSRFFFQLTSNLPSISIFKLSGGVATSR